MVADKEGLPRKPDNPYSGQPGEGVVLRASPSRAPLAAVAEQPGLRVRLCQVALVHGSMSISTPYSSRSILQDLPVDS